jgi:hypothetical protein
VSDAPKPNGKTPPTAVAVLKNGGEYAVVECCPFCRGQHFVTLKPGLQRANCDTWHPRAKGGFVVSFDREAK